MTAKRNYNFNADSWSDEEDAILRKVYPELHGPSIASSLLSGRSLNAIWIRARLLGINANRRNHSRKLSAEERAAISLRQTGKPATGRSAKGAENKGAKTWQFENKSLGVVISGTNLEELVRNNQHLFPIDAVNTKYKDGCSRAAVCLRSLSANIKDQSKASNSWKGWVFLRKSSVTHQHGGEI